MQGGTIMRTMIAEAATVAMGLLAMVLLLALGSMS
jgi:hypothetical protein